MDRRTLAFFALLLGGLAALALGATLLTRPSTSRPDGPTVDGIVVGVDSAGLADVSGFRLRTNDGRTLQFGLRSLRDAVQFPPGHLQEHAVNSVPVRVWYRDSGGTLDALWLEDAPVS